MKLGFTGSQGGMTVDQQHEVSWLLEALHPTEFHHGDCIGSDVQAANLCRTGDPSVKIICHPPENNYKRAMFKSDASLTPKPYLERNRDIVDASDVMIACPKEDFETLRSGTWATIRYARKVRRKLHIIWPNGDIETW